MLFWKVFTGVLALLTLTSGMMIPMGGEMMIPMEGGMMHGMEGDMQGGMHMPRPYGFGYNAKDKFGNSHYRNEKSDGSGTVTGAYGYTDNHGLFRTVNYVAGAGGFQANVQTNEPGTARHSPAHVIMASQHPPPMIQSVYGMGGMGMGAGKLMH
ncbi:hypothetical protein AVEN_256272-1 [Araneus ventricosus]|uniref:Adult-specific rigid cuticular protein 15.7 n=2 Tax=Araneus ventricosus TaxID=182803 RepID=A0A4Y2UEW3_ARAVE|nr:hypothetical protein AVEN_217936-1 [Araneus ventricosus]GBO11579.1 hypothetical protein AVEN_256272-1 [Araneus ventricosus]